MRGQSSEQTEWSVRRRLTDLTTRRLAPPLNFLGSTTPAFQQISFVIVQGA